MYSILWSALARRSLPAVLSSVIALGLVGIVTRSPLFAFRPIVLTAVLFVVLPAMALSIFIRLPGHRRFFALASAALAAIVSLVAYLNGWAFTSLAAVLSGLQDWFAYLHARERHEGGTPRSPFWMMLPRALRNEPPALSAPVKARVYASPFLSAIGWSFAFLVVVALGLLALLRGPDLPLALAHSGYGDWSAAHIPKFIAELSPETFRTAGPGARAYLAATEIYAGLTLVILAGLAAMTIVGLMRRDLVVARPIANERRLVNAAVVLAITGLFWFFPNPLVQDTERPIALWQAVSLNILFIGAPFFVLADILASCVRRRGETADDHSG